MGNIEDNEELKDELLAVESIFPSFVRDEHVAYAGEVTVYPFEGPIDVSVPPGLATIAHAHKRKFERGPALELSAPTVSRPPSSPGGGAGSDPGGGASEDTGGGAGEDTGEGAGEGAHARRRSPYVLRQVWVPPLVLNFELPPGYPHSKPPAYTLSCPWLPPALLRRLCDELDRKHRAADGGVVIFEWLMWLKEDAMEFLALKQPLRLLVPRARTRARPARQDTAASSPAAAPAPAPALVHGPAVFAPQSGPAACAALSDTRYVQNAASTGLLVRAVLQHDREESELVFRSDYFTCAVCFDEKLGADCIQLSNCGHIFCCDCLQSFFAMHVQEGTVRMLQCPEPSCKHEVLPTDVRSLLGAAAYERYERLSFQTTLSEMKDVIYCPRVGCGAPVILENPDSCAVCSLCTYAFCARCNRGWHGANPCPIDDLARHLREFEDADGAERARLLRMYGEQHFERLREEVEAEKWIADNSQPCPKCGAPISRTEGCAKMTCVKCKCFFCWLCLEVLSASNPYAHFSDQRSGCRGQLFVGRAEADLGNMPGADAYFDVDFDDAEEWWGEIFQG